MIEKARVYMLAIAFATACGNDPAQPIDDDDPDPPPPPNVVTLAAAGNIVSCGDEEDAMATAAIIDTLPSNTIVAALGDNVFEDGTLENFQTCYEKAWGKFKTRTRAVVGNHERQGNYDIFRYFSDMTGTAAKGWYSYEAGSWHVIVLHIHDFSSFGATSEQMDWLRSDLAANTGKKCTLAMWHDPRFLSSNDPTFNVRGGQKHVWQALYDAGVDVVLNGGQHQYERMRPMDPDGNVDEDRGILQINSGVGGHSWTAVSNVHPNQAAFRTGFGVLVMKLKEQSYDFTFVSSTGASSDSGSGVCH